MENQASDASPLLRTLVVDTLVDENDGRLGAGGVSLREALAAVETGGTITFAAELANQDAGFGQGVVGLTLGELVVDKSVTVEGLGADQLTISGNGQSRVFRLDDGDKSVRSDVTLKGLSITDGVGEQAGGILSVGENLIFDQGYLAENTGGIATALDASGRAEIAEILVSRSLLFANQDFALSTQGKLTLTDSRVINTAGVGIRHVGEMVLQRSGTTNNQGRGIVSTGSLQLLSSQVESNLGDGIRHTGSLTAQDASITNNQGNGIISVGELQIFNSQIGSNTAAGVVINDTMTLVESSIFNNGEDGVAAFATNSDARISTTDSFITNNAGSDISSAIRAISSAISPVVSPEEATPPPTDTTGNKIGGTSGNDRLFGTDAGDRIRSFEGRDRIRGRGGDDNIQGGIGDDRLIGGGGDDVMGGGKGQDRLSGGTGRDRFVYSSVREGGDTITDFTVGQDLIDLSAIFNRSDYNSATPFEDYVRIGTSASGKTRVSVLDVNSDRTGSSAYREIARLDDVAVQSLDASSFVV